MDPKFFKTAALFRKWLEANHARESELLVGFYKVGCGKPSMSWPESVEQALCFGWIDGVRKSIDDESYTIRFTPRRPGSIWSAVNIRKIEELTKTGLMWEAGLVAFSKRSEDKSKIYSYENEPMELTAPFEKKLQANKRAWAWFQSQAPSYRKTAIKWVMTAKQEKTRVSRMDTLIADCEGGRKIKPLSY